MWCKFIRNNLSRRRTKDLEQRARQEAQRQQEARQRHGEAVNRLNSTLARNMLRSGFNNWQGLPEKEPVEGDVTHEQFIPADGTVRPY